MKKLLFVIPVLSVIAFFGTRLLPSGPAAAAVERVLEERLGRDVSIEASRFAGFTSLRLDGVSVSSAAGSSFHARHLVVKAGVIALLRGRVSAGEFRIEGASVTWRDISATGSALGVFDETAGVYRLDRFDLAAGAARASGAARTGRFEVSWTDADPSSFTALAPLPEGLAATGPTSGGARVELSTTGYRANVHVDLSSATLEWKSVASKAAGTPMTFSAALRRAGDNLMLRDLSVDLASIRLSGEGEISGSGDVARQAALRLKTEDFDIADLFRHLNVTVTRDLTLSGPASATLTVDGGTRGGRFVADIDGTRLEAGYRGTFRKPAGMPLRVLTEGRYTTPLAIDLPSVRLEMGGIEINGRGSYTPGKERPTYTFRLKSNVFPLRNAAALLPAVEPFQPAGEGVVSFRVIRGDRGPALSGTLTLVSAGAMIGGSEVSGVSGSVRFTDDAFSARALTGRLDGSALRADVAAHRFGGRAFLETDLRVDDFDLARFLSRTVNLSSAPFDAAGTLRAGHIGHPSFTADDLTVEWNLAGISGSSVPATGTLSWRQGPGQLADLTPLVTASTAARAFLLPLALLQRGEFDLPNVPFEAIDADVTVSGGVAALQTFLLQGESRNIGIKGAFPLLGEGPLALSVRLRAAAGSGLTRISVEGTPASPSFSLP